MCVYIKLYTYKIIVRRTIPSVNQFPVKIKSLNKYIYRAIAASRMLYAVFLSID